MINCERYAEIMLLTVIDGDRETDREGNGRECSLIRSKRIRNKAENKCIKQISRKYIDIADKNGMSEAYCTRKRVSNSPKRKSSVCPTRTFWVSRFSCETRIQTLLPKSKSGSRGRGPRHSFSLTTERDEWEEFDIICNCRPLASTATNLYTRFSSSLGFWSSIKHTLRPLVPSVLVSVRSVMFIPGATLEERQDHYIQIRDACKLCYSIKTSHIGGFCFPNIKQLWECYNVNTSHK